MQKARVNSRRHGQWRWFQCECVRACTANQDSIENTFGVIIGVWIESDFFFSLSRVKFNFFSVFEIKVETERLTSMIASSMVEAFGSFKITVALLSSVRLAPLEMKTSELTQGTRAPGLQHTVRPWGRRCRRLETVYASTCGTDCEGSRNLVCFTLWHKGTRSFVSTLKSPRKIKSEGWKSVEVVWFLKQFFKFFVLSRLILIENIQFSSEC